jgi:hypothetical protein
MKSATGCKIPLGPVKLGPILFCILASIFLSIQSQNIVKRIMKVNPGKTSTRKRSNRMSINRGHHYLSVHEKHGSKLTKFGGTSAMLSPIAVVRNAGIFANVGVRTLTRSGIAVPLLFT